LTFPWLYTYFGRCDIWSPFWIDPIHHAACICLITDENFCTFETMTIKWSWSYKLILVKFFAAVVEQNVAFHNSTLHTTILLGFPPDTISFIVLGHHSFHICRPVRVACSINKPVIAVGLSMIYPCTMLGSHDKGFSHNLLSSLVNTSQQPVLRPTVQENNRKLINEQEQKQ